MVEASGPEVHEARPSRHIPALDGLRGIAILLVIPHNAPYFPALSGGPLWVASLVANVGWIGVQLFFVLSGFLITRQLLDSRGASNYYQVFFARRVLRIFPLYYAALIVGLLVFPRLFPALTGGALPGWDQLWLWTFLFNWAHPLGAEHYGLPHFWSLAVEEQFYLLWPFLVRKREPRKLLSVCVWIALGALATRIVMRGFGASVEMVYEFTVCRMDALAIGAIAAALLHVPALEARLRESARWLLPGAFALALAGALVTHAYTRDLSSTLTVGQSFLSLFFVAILLASVLAGSAWNRRLGSLLSISPLRSVGKYSYGMYVIHYPLVLGMVQLLPRFKSAFGDVFYVVPFMSSILLLSYAAAYLSYHVLEQRFLRLKRWFVPTAVHGPAFETR